MRHLVVVVLVCATFLSVGCGGSDFTGPYFAVTGALEKPVASNDYSLVELNKVSIESTPLKKELDPGHFISSGHTLKLEIRDLPDTNFKALISPTYGISTDYAEGYIVTTPEVGLYLHCGWLYLTGVGVYSQSSYVAFGADGSKMAMNIIKSPSIVHRVYYLEGTSGWFDVTGAAPKVFFSTPGMYVDVKPDLTIVGPSPIPAGDPFITNLNKAVTAAKL